MKTKHIINIGGLEQFRFGEDKNLWRLPYNKNKRHYRFRLIKLQKAKRWILNGEPWSMRQLEGKLLRDPNPIEIYPDDSDCPF